MNIIRMLFGVKDHEENVLSSDDYKSKLTTDILETTATNNSVIEDDVIVKKLRSLEYSEKNISLLVKMMYEKFVLTDNEGDVVTYLNYI